MDSPNSGRFQFGFGFWLSVVSFVLAGLIIWGTLALQRLRETKDEPKTSREMALTCTSDMATQFHIHPHLKIEINGVGQIIPANVGITSVCMNSIHTHDASGTLHIESPVKKDFTLGDFFAVWGKEFNKNQILDYKTDTGATITLTVNGKAVDTYEDTVMNDNDVIVISYSKK